MPSSHVQFMAFWACFVLLRMREQARSAPHFAHRTQVVIACFWLTATSLVAYGRLDAARCHDLHAS